MTKSTDLKDELAQWDGSVESLGLTYQHRHADKDFLKELLALFTVQPLQLPASWLLKHALEDGVILADKQVSRLLKSAASLENWQARLHLLQSLQYLSIPSNSTDVLHAFLTACLQEDNKFIRAWAYQGFIELAQQHAAYQAESNSLINRAMLEEAPAIKARLRNRLKNSSAGSA